MKITTSNTTYYSAIFRDDSANNDETMKSGRNNNKQENKTKSHIKILLSLILDKVVDVDNEEQDGPMSANAQCDTVQVGSATALNTQAKESSNDYIEAVLSSIKDDVEIYRKKKCSFMRNEEI